MTTENPAAGRYPVAALALALMLAGTLLPTPLFELYRRVWQLTPEQISLVFSPPEHRAEMLSAFLVACYLGFSVPALLLGIAANQFGLFAAFMGAAVVLGAIAVTIIALTSERNLRVA